jgi:hypothetical protein|tara:strand:- start:1630 stop:2247 length:618 start_codon:yes stop_codon:yes gene_type:complete
MTRGALKQWRLVIPVVIFFGLYGLAAKSLGFEQIAVPTSINDVFFNLPALLAVFAYNVLPLRKWTNAGHHRAVQRNVREKMAAIAGADIEELPQKKIMDIFYRQIDNDPTLKAKSEIIMSNGLIWTSLADLSVLSIIYAAFSILSYIVGLFQSDILFIQYAGLAIVSLLFQMVVTGRHIRLSDDQLEYMADYRSDEIISDFGQNS